MLFMGDGTFGLWTVVRAVYPQARHQVWCHKMLNVMDKPPARLQPDAKALPRDIYTAPTRETKHSTASYVLRSDSSEAFRGR
jgi:transposase-like protein